MPSNVSNSLARFFVGLFRKQKKTTGKRTTAESQPRSEGSIPSNRTDNPSSELQKDYENTLETLELLTFDAQGPLSPLSDTYFATQPSDAASDTCSADTDNADTDRSVSHMKSTLDMISLMSDHRHKTDSGFISMISEANNDCETDEALVEEGRKALIEEGRRLVAVMSSAIWLGGERDDVARVLEAFD
jgi:hypothetical protein